MRLEVLTALLAEPGQRLLERATREYAGATGPSPPAAAAGSARSLAVGNRLRRDHDPDLVAAALTQVELRGRAVTKFGAADAARMYFTPEALEQATPRAVAEHRADRLAGGGDPASTPPGGQRGRGSDGGGAARLVDLGCGVGSDLVAAARAGLEVTGVEQDPVRAALARANLAALGLPGRVVEGTAEQADLSGFDLVFADPARRDARGRVFDPAAYSPPWSFAADLLQTRTGCVKIAPAVPHRLVPDGVEAEWVSEHGEVKEAALWSGDLATATRRATLLPSAATLASTGATATVGPVGGYLYEPDGAVIRAGLLGELADVLGAHLLEPDIAYLSADRRVDTPYARCFTVVDRLPYREKALRAALRARDVGPLTVKKRGVQVAPEVLRRRLGLRGRRPATIVLTRAGGASTALLVEPVSNPGG